MISPSKPPANGIRRNRYAAVKVCAAFEHDRGDGESSTASELAFYRALGEVETDHEGAFCLQMLQSSFTMISQAKREHRCLVYEPAVSDLNGVLERLKKDGAATSAVLKQLIRHLLMALDFLLTELKVVHADIKIDNVRFRLTDNAAFAQVAQALKVNSMPAKYDRKAKRMVYSSINIMAHMEDIPWGIPILADLGEARTMGGGESWKYGWIYAEPCRPPEVHLGMHWDSSVDIWATGVLIWYSFERELLFGSDDNSRSDPETFYLGRMAGVLGPPPVEFMKRSKRYTRWWNEDGIWKACDHVEVHNASLEERVTCFEGQEATCFADFVRSMLRWKPEDRATARQLLAHPFLQEE